MTDRLSRETFTGTCPLEQNSNRDLGEPVTNRSRKSTICPLLPLISVPLLSDLKPRKHPRLFTLLYVSSHRHEPLLPDVEALTCFLVSTAISNRRVKLRSPPNPEDVWYMSRASSWRVLLIRLFQVTTSGSVGSAPSTLAEDSPPVSAPVCQRRGLPAIPGRVPLARVA